MELGALIRCFVMLLCVSQSHMLHLCAGCVSTDMAVEVSVFLLFFSLQGVNPNAVAEFGSATRGKEPKIAGEKELKIWAKHVGQDDTILIHPYHKAVLKFAGVSDAQRHIQACVFCVRLEAQPGWSLSRSKVFWTNPHS